MSIELFFARDLLIVVERNDREEMDAGNESGLRPLPDAGEIGEAELADWARLRAG